VWCCASSSWVAYGNLACAQHAVWSPMTPLYEPSTRVPGYWARTTHHACSLTQITSWKRYAPYVIVCVICAYLSSLSQTGHTRSGALQSVYINARSLKYSNWTRYINSAPEGVADNIEFVVGDGVGDYCGRAYTRGTRIVEPGQPLWASYLL
jgi:hypothetical protein